MVLYSMIFGLALFLLAVIAKSPLIFIAAGVCFAGLIFEDAIHDTWFQGAVIIMVTVSVITGLFQWRGKRNG